MSKLSNPPSYLTKPARSLVLSWAVYSVIVFLIFYAVGRIPINTAESAPLVTALPGLSLGGYLLLLLRYFSHYDEMLKGLLLKALSASALVGFSVQLSSLIRADITSFKQFDDALVIVMMALAFIVTALSLKIKYR